MGNLVFEPIFLYRCADLLIKLAEETKESRAQLTPELVAKWASVFGLGAEEVRNLGEVLNLLAIMMGALAVVRDSTIEQLLERIIELERVGE